jgi:tetratricopeptide (TPR) repeat protein
MNIFRWGDACPLHLDLPVRLFESNLRLARHHVQLLQIESTLDTTLTRLKELEPEWDGICESQEWAARMWDDDPQSRPLAELCRAFALSLQEEFQQKLSVRMRQVWLETGAEAGEFLEDRRATLAIAVNRIAACHTLMDVDELHHRLQQLRTQAQDTSDVETLIDVHIHTGLAEFRQGQPRQALEQYRLAQSLVNKNTPPRQSAVVLGNLGSTLAMLGEWVEAVQALEQATALCRSIGMVNGLAGGLNHLGMIAFHQGDTELAEVKFLELLDFASAIHDENAAAFALQNLGLVYLRRGRVRLAELHFTEAFELFQQFEDRSQAAKCRLNGAICKMHQGQHDAARAELTTLLDLTPTLNDRETHAAILGNLGLLEMNTANWHAALSHFDEQRRMAHHDGHFHQKVLALANMAACHLQLSQWEECFQKHAEAIAIAEEYQDLSVLGLAQNNLGVAYVQSQRLSEARYCFRQQAQLAKHCQDLEGFVRGAINLALVSADLGDVDQALSIAAELAPIFEQHDPSRLSWLGDKIADWTARRDGDRNAMN